MRPLPPASAGTAARPAPARPDAPPAQPFRTRHASFQPASFQSLPGWGADPVEQAWRAFQASCAAVGRKPAWQSVCGRARQVDAADAPSVRRFFEREFALYEIREPDQSPSGMITGYYEPLLHGSRTRRAPFVHPVYATPGDLVYLDARRLPPEARERPVAARLDGRSVVPLPPDRPPHEAGTYLLDIGPARPDIRDRRLRLRVEGRRIVPYPPRAQIERAGLDQAHVLAWVDDPAALYAMQIQGSGKIRLAEGGVLRVGYAEQNGWPFVPSLAFLAGARRTGGPAQQVALLTRGLAVLAGTGPDGTGPDAPEPDGADSPGAEPDGVGHDAAGQSDLAEHGSADAPAAPTRGIRPVRSPGGIGAMRLADPPEAARRADGSDAARQAGEPDALRRLIEALRPRTPGTAAAAAAAPAASAISTGPAASAISSTGPAASAPVPAASHPPAPAGAGSWRNDDPSYVFFRPIPENDDGPIGALGVPLTPGRSVAVDPRTTPLGAPVFLSTTQPGRTGRLDRLMLAQDTGGAVRGAVRADYFWGFGAAAGRQAARMKEVGRMWLLLPHEAVPAALAAVRTRGVGAAASDEPAECVLPDPDLCAED